MPKPRSMTDLTLADVRLMKSAADRGPEGEVRKDSPAKGVVRNVVGPASDAVRRTAIAERVKEHEPKAAVVVAKKPEADPAGPMGGPTIPGAYKNIKQRPGRLNREIDKQTGY